MISADINRYLVPDSQKAPFQEKEIASFILTYPLERALNSDIIKRIEKSDSNQFSEKKAQIQQGINRHVLSILKQLDKPQKVNPLTFNWLTMAKVELYSTAKKICSLLNKCFNNKRLTVLEKKYDFLLDHQYQRYRNIKEFYKSDYLGFSINAASPDCIDFLQLYPYEEWVKTRSSNGQCYNKGQCYKMRKGICYGMSLWFIYLYLNTFKAFKDPEQHLITLTKIFENGATKECAMLQIASKNDGSKNLGIVAEEIFNLSTNPEKRVQIETNQLDKKNEVLKTLKETENGIYQVSMLNLHSIVWIKIAGQSYLFEPNLGLQKTTPEQLFEYFVNFNKDNAPKKRSNDFVINSIQPRPKSF